jgi:hypothetical protein
MRSCTSPTSLLTKHLITLNKSRMTKDGATIELQQPLGQADGASGTSDVAKEEVSYHHGNENDQADMARLGKKQRLDVREEQTWYAASHS